ncbi:MAG TPA: hypothetical protein VGK24_05815 [Candidatus Angelobacter sp.]|jgi:hypothetical protein
MPNFAYPHKAWASQQDPRLSEIFDAFEQAVNKVGVQTNANPVGTSTDAPPQISAVTAKVLVPGTLHLQIADNNPVTRGLWYHYEISSSPNFEVGTVIHAGATPSRDLIVSPGAGPLFARAYSQYLTSLPSLPVLVSGAVDPGGSARTGSIAGAGSGTEPQQAPQPGAGFGFLPSRPGIRPA